MALCLAGAIGATFMTRDATRRPILAATPATVAGSAPTSRRRRPLAAWLISVASALWVSGFTLVVGASPGGHGQGDNMADRMTDHTATHTGLSGGRLLARGWGSAFSWRLSSGTSSGIVVARSS